MDELLKRREDLTHELNEIKLRAERIKGLLLEVNVHISNKRYEMNKREEDK